MECNQPRKAYIKKSVIFENSFKNVLPQKTVTKTVHEHFANENGKRKKSIVIGFDGARADALLGIVKVGTPDETAIAKEDNLPITYRHPCTDKELHADMLASIDNDDDLIFGIYEEPDVNGH